MHFRFSLATGLAFLLSSLSLVSASPSRLLEPRSSKTCAPTTSEYLYQVHADGVSKLGFMGHYSYIRLATNLFAPGFEESDQLVWNLVESSSADSVFQIQTADGAKCASTRGNDQKVGVATCDTSESSFEISCTSCGTTSCGDPFANNCSIRSTTELDQCLSRIGKLIMTQRCNDKDKKQKWGFNLA
ncbi:uncharacterized protein JCM6883_002319 [Sporobolomyces salmoneus]|uniref:uncharacterized protein n=1 Tax=Sporobolomyces salmoneus TaxID=183962 RepID=UPI00316E331D